MVIEPVVILYIKVHSFFFALNVLNGNMKNEIIEKEIRVINSFYYYRFQAKIANYLCYFLNLCKFFFNTNRKYIINKKENK